MGQHSIYQKSRTVCHTFRAKNGAVGWSLFLFGAVALEFSLQFPVLETLESGFVNDPEELLDRSDGGIGVAVFAVGRIARFTEHEAAIGCASSR